MEQVLNIRDTQTMLLESIKNNQFQVTKDMFNKANGIIAKEEALYMYIIVHIHVDSKLEIIKHKGKYVIDY